MRILALLFLLFTVLFVSACPKSESQNQNASVDAKRYNLKGKVVAVDKSKKKATIAHEEIPGYMQAMTMDFPIRGDWVWEDLTKDAEISAQLVVDEKSKDGYWLENIAIITAPNPNNPAPPVNENFAQVGKEIPDFALTNQDGKRFTLKDYRGKALAITFIYARTAEMRPIKRRDAEKERATQRRRRGRRADRMLTTERTDICRAPACCTDVRFRFSGT